MLYNKNQQSILYIYIIYVCVITVGGLSSTFRSEALNITSCKLTLRCGVSPPSVDHFPTGFHHEFSNIFLQLYLRYPTSIARTSLGFVMFFALPTPMIDGRVWCGRRFMTRTRRLRASAATMRLAGYHAQRCHWVLELDGKFEP